MIVCHPLIFKNNGLKGQKESTMSSNNDQLKGSINSTVGSVKEASGRAVGDRRLENEGSMQKTKGHVQKLAGAVKNVVQKSKDLLGVKSDRS